jgi:ribosome-binding protein aMBF1 (putative translation factor)
MAERSFRGLLEEAQLHDDFWVEAAILEITEAVVRRMDELAISRSELARRLGTSPAYVTKILRGSANFTLASIVKLARALECDVSVCLAPRNQGAACNRHRSKTPGSSSHAKRTVVGSIS